MEPVRYARTPNGVSIAYSRGAPVVFASNPCELHGNSPHPHTRFTTEELARRGRRVLRYDLRGMGASDRHVPDMSFDKLVRDIEAVGDSPGKVVFAYLPGGIESAFEDFARIAAKHGGLDSPEAATEVKAVAARGNSEFVGPPI